MARIMGVHPDDGETLDRACDLGLAFQMANIARDIVEDAEADRCYLPQKWLEALVWHQGPKKCQKCVTVVTNRRGDKAAGTGRPQILGPPRGLSKKPY